MEEEIQKKEYTDYLADKFDGKINDPKKYANNLNYMIGEPENKKASYQCISCKGFVFNPLNCNKCTMVVCSEDFE